MQQLKALWRIITVKFWTKCNVLYVAVNSSVLISELTRKEMFLRKKDNEQNIGFLLFVVFT